MSSIIKKFVLWSYDRETSQYLLFCLLIVAFIFLTPSSWFKKDELLATQKSRLIVQTPGFSPENVEFESRVRELSGNPAAEIIAWRRKTNDRGETFYEIDIR